MKTTFLVGGGEMGDRVRAFDWTRTALGPTDIWPQSLKTATGILLNSGYPMYIAWGPQFVQLYNDAYRPILGETKHPHALGATAQESFPEIWDEIGPMFRTVMEESKPSTYTDMMLSLHRYGFAEECYFVFSYSPVLDEAGKAAGVFVTVLETTDRVLRERRQRILRDIASLQSQGSRDEIFREAVRLIGACPEDVPFVALCVRDEDKALSIAARSGAPALSDSELLSLVVAMESDPDETSDAPRSLPAAIPCAPWPEPVTDFVCRRIMPPGASEAAGVLVLGRSPRLRWDGDYAAFCAMCANNLATVLADAEALANERKRAEALAEVDRVKTAFFSNVSHEFRTPLTLMMGPLEDALSDSSVEQSRGRFEQLSTVYRNAQRLLRLVNSLLDFSRIEAGRASARFQPTEIAQYTADLVSSFRSATEKAGLDLIVEAAPMARPVYVDRDMWENIVLNLMSNAFKFTLAGAIRVKVGTGPDGRSATVSFSDTGVGIPKHELPRLFDRFHRVEGVVGRSIEGSGIGLALVHELVALHGARLSVDSEVGRGTSFAIEVPFGYEHLPAEHVSTTSEPPVMGIRSVGFVAEALRWLPAGGGGEVLATTDTHPVGGAKASQHVLVVDDNADMRDYLAHLLESHGYQVSLAEDGVSALEAIGRAPPHLVLSDLMMPRLDGFGLLAKLRSEEATKDLPFIALTARAGEESKVEGLEAGADDYLVKPFSSRELFARVGSAIELSRVRRQAREALEDEYGRLQRLFEQAPSFIATTRGPDHEFEFANAAYRKLVGDRDIIGKSVAVALPEVRGQGFLELLDDVYRTGKPYVGENVLVRLQDNPEEDQRDVVVNFVYEAITDVDGSIIGVFVEGHDVTPQHKANVHLKMVVDELNHRVKNMLAIVQGISQQTFKGTGKLEAEREAFVGRLTALAAAHDLLTQVKWKSPTLDSVARRLLSSHAREDGYEVCGPHIELNPKMAVTLSMMFHELCTNALKYGALSVSGGSVSVTWELRAKEPSNVRITWRERGGPTVKAPAKRGFGTRLIERALGSELGGGARLRFHPEGVVCEIDAALPDPALQHPL